MTRNELNSALLSAVHLGSDAASNNLAVAEAAHYITLLADGIAPVNETHVEKIKAAIERADSASGLTAEEAISAARFSAALTNLLFTLQPSLELASEPFEATEDKPNANVNEELEKFKLDAQAENKGTSLENLTVGTDIFAADKETEKELTDTSVKEGDVIGVEIDLKQIEKLENESIIPLVSKSKPIVGVEVDASSVTTKPISTTTEAPGTAPIKTKSTKAKSGDVPTGEK